ncbi:hypothetical protein Acr_05g0005920 [Actinidia rufa]|uniref:Uncharacterized protein n=1 Tax=Actinidia rufa TaxID=165716 RepID=A0A7J0EKG0_9ERIC|nr:hypothetical protein Acr_05g0005920 [Actinidia rufa]
MIPTITGYSPDGNLSDYVSYISEISFHTHPSEDHAVTHGHGRPLIVRGPVPRNPSNFDCWLLARIFTTTVWRRLWERQFSMHLRSRNLPRPSASSPLDNRAPPMANASQVPDLEGLHHEIHGMAEQMRVMNENNTRLIQLLAAANPQPPAAPSVPDVERSRHSNCSGDRSHNVSTERARDRRRAPSPSLRERSSSSESSQTRSRVRRGRSPHRGDHTRARDKSTSQKIRDLDARLDAINTGTNAPITVDALVRQTDPPFTERGYSDEVMCKAFSATLKGPAKSWFRKLSPGTVDSFGKLSRLFVANFMSCRNRQKNASHLFTVHQKETESLKDFVKRFNQAVLDVEDPSDKVIIMAMMEGLRPEELAEAKRRRRGKEDHKRKEPDTRRADYREEMRYKRPDRDSKRSNNRRPRTPPRRPEFNLPPLNTPVAQVLSEIKHEEFIKWPGKIKTDPQKRNRNKYCEFYRDHGHNTEDCFQLKEQIADLIKRGYLRKYITDRPPPNSPERKYGDNRPTAGKYTNDPWRLRIRWMFDFIQEEGMLGVPLGRSKKSVRKDENWAGQIASFPYPLGWINLPITLGTEPQQTTVWQDFIVVDCPSPYNSILGRPTLGRIKAITSTYHLKMKFSTLTGIGETAGDDMETLRDEIEQLILEDPRETENTKPLEEVVPISIHPNYPERQVMIGTELTDELRDVPGIDPEVAMHKLFTKPDYSSVHQKRRKFAPERLKVIEDEISKLIKANVVREAHYPDWLANVVVAPKKGGKWRVCVDFTDLNKACPKDQPDIRGLKKIAYALMIAARKLRHYFQAHSIIVLTDQPLKQILQRPDTSGRLLKWSIELSEFYIEYKPRTAIKAQALSDFIVESTHEDSPQPETNPFEVGIPKEPTSEQNLAHWILYVDGSSNQHGCGAGLVLRAPSGEQMEYAIRMGFQATNNEAEYEALLAELRVATELGAQSLEVFSDSQLVVNQVQGDYLAKDSRMIAYLGEVKTLSAKIKEFKINQIPREDNKTADALTNLASTFEFISDRTTLEMSPTKKKLNMFYEKYTKAYAEITPEPDRWRRKLFAKDILADHGTRCGYIRSPKGYIISDNARQFDNDRFRLFCSDLAISHHFSSPGHPQANGQVESDSLRVKLHTPWSSELSPVIPVEIGVPSFRTLNFNGKGNEGELRLNLDLLDEKRERAELRQAAYKSRIAKYYNERVKHRSFLPGDLVLRRVTLSTRDPSAGKLSPTWEGPYKVIKVSRTGTCWLEDLNGKALSHPWNAEHLKKYYQ